MPIVDKPGKPAVVPSEATVLDGSYQPLSRPIFIYVNTKSLAKPEVKEFVEYYHEERRQARQGSQVRAAAAQGLHHRPGAHREEKKGTVFGGKSEVGVSIEELLEREAKL